jgi:hypothetical protein
MPSQTRRLVKPRRTRIAAVETPAVIAPHFGLTIRGGTLGLNKERASPANILIAHAPDSTTKEAKK